MLSTYAAIFSTLTLLVSAQAADPLAALPSNVTPEQSSKVVNDIADYVTSVEAQPQFTNAAFALASAVPSSLMSDLEADPTAFFESVLTASPTPEWLSAVPTSVLGYYSGINADVISIATKDVMGSAMMTGSAAASSAMVTGSTASAMTTAKSESKTSSTKSSGTSSSSSSSASVQATGAAVKGAPVLGAGGVLGALGVAVAGAML